MGKSKYLSRKEQESGVLEFASKNAMLMNEVFHPISEYAVQVWKHGAKIRQGLYKFTPEEINQQASDYFEFTLECKIVPNLLTLCIWFGINRETFKNWLKTQESIQVEGLKLAVDLIEYQNIAAAQAGVIKEICTIFYLKAVHGWQDSSPIDVNVKHSFAAVRHVDEEIWAGEAERILKIVGTENTHGEYSENIQAEGDVGAEGDG